MRARTRRLWTIAAAALLLALASLLAFIALRRTADLFYTPTRLAELGGPQPGLTGKVGGFVARGSLTYEAEARIRFLVVDDAHQIEVTYVGPTPDLFQEGSGVVADGVFSEDGVFEASRLLAKHDENYVPRELKRVEGPAE
ncbi:MAG: cytochrome c maturation protein CcmE [Pseudomonadota bacterium]